MATSPTSNSRLLAVSAATLGLYFVAMIILWVTGVEPIYANPPPFYAGVELSFSSLVTLGTAELVCVVAAFGLRIRSGTLAIRERVGFLAAMTLAGATGIAGMMRRGGDAAYAVEVAWHLLPIAVFLLGSSFIFSRRSAELPDFRFAFAVALWGALFAGSVAMMRGGPQGISQAYERYAYEYISDIGAGGSIRGLFARYTELHPHLSMHSKVHPPGPIALLWMMSFVAGRGAMGLSLATVAFGSLSVVPLFFWARDLVGREGARIAAVLYVLTPTIVLFTATSADIAFMPFTLTTLFLFWRAIERQSIGYAIGAGIGYALMSLVSFSLISVGAFFGLVGLWKLRAPGARLAVVQTAVVMAGAAAAVHAAVYFWSGFNVFECFRLAQAQFTLDQAMLDKYAPRYPAWTFRFWNPMALFYFAGIPVSLLFLRRIRYAETGGRAIWIIFAATLLALDALYLARGEGERSAMYVMPFLVVPAADALRQISTGHSTPPVFGAVTFLAAQCWITEALFYTYW